MKKEHKQEYPCETCGLTSEGYFGLQNELGYYDRKLVWHGPVEQMFDTDDEMESEETLPLEMDQDEFWSAREYESDYV